MFSCVGGDVFYNSCAVKEDSGIQVPKLLDFPISSMISEQIQLEQTIMAGLLLGVRQNLHITPFQQTIHWLPFYYQVQFKVVLSPTKFLKTLDPSWTMNENKNNTIGGRGSSPLFYLTLPPSSSE